MWIRLTRLDGDDSTLEIYSGNPNHNAAEVLDTWLGGYVSVWHLDDATDSASTHNGEPFDTRFVPGRFGGAAEFDSDPETRIVVPAHTDFILSPQITVSAWINGTYDPLLYNAILGKPRADDPVRNEILFAVNREALQCNAYIVDTAWATRDDQPLPSGWRFVVATIDGDEVRLYVDGEVVEMRTVGGPAEVTSMTDLTIGIDTQDLGATFDEDMFIGMIDELRLKAVRDSDLRIRQRFAIESGAAVTVGNVEQRE